MAEKRTEGSARGGHLGQAREDNPPAKRMPVPPPAALCASPTPSQFSETPAAV